MDSFLSFVPTLLSGGLTGLLGSIFSRVTDFYERKQAHAHEVELRRLDNEVAKTEAAGAEAAARAQAEGEAETAAFRALEASYRDASQRLTKGDSWLMLFADFVRTMLRPGVTWVLIGLCAAIYWTLGHGDESLRSQLVHMVIYLTETVVLWWFGTRKPRQTEAGKAA
ncbi:MAG: hypothetical protein F4Y03_12420 [Alphaproteobacteria bacterium]|nr:hypothetical protein [Alphaproteobacteria bacterium]